MQDISDKNTEHAESALLIILDKIHSLARNGKRQYFKDGPTPVYIVHELESRGFKVEQRGRYNEIDTVISW